MKVLRQSLFARRDYEGLSERAKEVLAKKRKGEAKRLLSERRNLKKVLEDAEKEVSRDAEKKIRNSLVSGRSDTGEILRNKSQKIRDMRKNFFKNSYDNLLQDSKGKSKKFREEVLELNNNSVVSKDLPKKNIGEKVKKFIFSKKFLIPSAITASGISGGIAYSKYKKKKQIENSRKSVLGKENIINNH